MKAKTTSTTVKSSWNPVPSLLETYKVNETANQLLLSSVSEEVWCAAPPGGKGRTIAGVACHIHNVRLMWLSAADKGGRVPGKLDHQKASRAQVMRALTESATAITRLIEKGLDHPAGQVPNFKPDVVTFLGYLIAHDSHHRGQIAMMARQAGHPLDAKIGFGLWEWGTLWKKAGFKR